MLEFLSGLILIIALLSFFGSFVLLIKPNFFHKKLTRKKVGFILMGSLLLLIITPTSPEQKARNEALRAEQEAERQAELAAQSAEEEAQAEQEAAEEQAKDAERALLDSLIASTSIYDDAIGTPNLRINFKNTSDKTIDGIEAIVYLRNNFDEPVGEWNRKVDEPLTVRTQETIAPGGTNSSTWNLAVYDSATKVYAARVIRVHFTDGTEIRY